MDPGRIPVVIFNSTSIVGAGARLASDIRGQGWRVDYVANWRPLQDGTTVYYPGRREPEARLLAETIGADRVRKSFDGIPQNRLTVIIGSGWQG